MRKTPFDGKERTRELSRSAIARLQRSRADCGQPKRLRRLLKPCSHWNSKGIFHSSSKSQFNTAVAVHPTMYGAARTIENPANNLLGEASLNCNKPKQSCPLAKLRTKMAANDGHVCMAMP